ncbi:MAG: SpoIIE family protein phosphatase [Mariprofundus sp.]|nr:SpoIIE family protein phosphatase [Mariprofundus sp.]
MLSKCLETQNERLLQALEISHLIAGELKLAPLLKQIMAHTQSIMNAETCSLFLFDEEKNELVFNVCAGEKEAQLKEICRLPMGKGIAGWCAQRGESLCIDDVYADAHFEVAFDRQTDFITRNMISTPLYVHQKLIGVCQVINCQHGVFSSSDQQLLEAMVPMMAIAIDNAHAHQQLLDAEIFQHDMVLAKSIQDSFLLDVLPELDAYRAVFHMRSAFDVGGDFYDAVHMPDHRMAYIVGDISGKGVSAAMLMSSVLSDLRLQLSRGGSASDIMNRFNVELCKKVQQGMFVSLLLMILNPKTGQIEIANAGHLPAIHLSQGSVWQHHEASGPPAGILSGIRYEGEMLSLAGGDMLLLYTDGVPDARNVSDEMLGTDRLLQWLNHAPSDANECLAYLKHCIAKFTADAKQSDDLTMLILQADQHD